MGDNCDSEDDDRLLHGGVNLVISSHTNTVCVCLSVCRADCRYEEVWILRSS